MINLFALRLYVRNDILLVCCAEKLITHISVHTESWNRAVRVYRRTV